MTQRQAEIRPRATGPENRGLRPVHTTPPSTAAGEAIAPGALADLVAAPGAEGAARARAALPPLLAHDARVLVTPASPAFPVQIAAPRGLREGLAIIEWSRMADGGAVADG